MLWLLYQSHPEDDQLRCIQNVGIICKCTYDDAVKPGNLVVFTEEAYTVFCYSQIKRYFNYTHQHNYTIKFKVLLKCKTPLWFQSYHVLYKIRITKLLYIFMTYYCFFFTYNIYITCPLISYVKTILNNTR